MHQAINKNRIFKDAEKTNTSNIVTRTLAVPIAYNEEKKIGSVIDRFNRDDVTDIVLMDDASSDNTPLVVKKKGIEVISHKEQKGVGSAIRTIIKYATDNNYDVLIILAGNDKDRPAEIPRLINPIIEDNYDFVQGSRYLKGGNYVNIPFYRQLSTRYLHPFIFSLITGMKITDSTNGFRAFKLSIFNDVRIDINQDWLNKYELEPYIFYKAIKLGYRVKEVPVTKIYPPKELGYTKMKPFTGWWSILRPLFYLGLGLKH